MRPAALALTALALPGAALAEASADSRDAMRAAVALCWNIGALSPGALQGSVTVGFSVDARGVPVADTLTMVATTLPEAEASQAYRAARRAILRCGAQGLPMPAGSGRDLELTFDPGKGAGS